MIGENDLEIIDLIDDRINHIDERRRILMEARERKDRERIFKPRMNRKGNNLMVLSNSNMNSGVGNSNSLVSEGEHNNLMIFGNNGNTNIVNDGNIINANNNSTTTVTVLSKPNIKQPPLNKSNTK